MAPRIDPPDDFQGLDEAVHDDGAPESSWLGRELAQRDRWLDAHLRRSFGQAYPLDQPISGQRGWAEPQFTRPGRLGPWTHMGTPGCQKLGGEWYIRADITNLAEMIALPYVSHPALLPVRPPGDLALLGEFTLAGTGAPANYGPIPTPLVEGPQRLGLVLWTPDQVYAASGNVALLHRFTLQSTAASFGALAPPYPMARVVDAAGRVVAGWTQIEGVQSLALSSDTLKLSEAVTLPGRAYDAADGLTWQLSSAASATSYGHLISVYMREATP